MKNSVKHSKIKNTAILFEILTRQLTTDIMNGTKKSKAQELIERNFNASTELGKEHRLYQALIKNRFDDTNKANDLINEVIEAHKRLNKTDLRNMKYNLIKEIKENYSIDSLFKCRMDNYKLYASIYKLLQAKSIGEEFSPEDSISARYTIVENITGKNVIIETPGDANDDDLKNMLIEYEKQNTDLRLLAYKILIERFNDKYRGLDENQKSLLKEYISNISSANSLQNYLTTAIPNMVGELTKISQKITDKVTRIKINEVLNQLDLIKDAKILNDNHVTGLLNVYELIKELKSVEK